MLEGVFIINGIIQAEGYVRPASLVAVGFTAIAVALGSPRASHAADPAIWKAGQRVFNLCRACHSVEEDGEVSQGPNLWNMVGAKAAENPDFAYSDVLAKSGIIWTEANLDQWIANPKTFLPGSKMAFIGIPKEEDRKALIAFLKSKGNAN